MALIKKNQNYLYSKIVETSGVYFFLNEQKIPIYIGKANNLRNRIKQHFVSFEGKERLIEKNTVYIKLFETNSEFEALVLEANMIREFQPKYNAALRDDKSRLYIVVTKETYPKVKLERKQNLKKNTYRFIFGPLNSASTGRQLLRKIRQVVPFCSDKSVNSKPCFYSQIGLCSPCPNYIEFGHVVNMSVLKNLYRQNIQKVISLLKGRGQQLLREMKKELIRLSEKEAYEDAIIVRDKISYLEQLFQRKLVFDERLSEANYISSLRERQSEALRSTLGLAKLERVECYDISNLAFKEATASMVVFKNGVASTDDYRRFKIKGRRQFDPEMLSEVLLRRLRHDEWPQPDLVVLDGGTPQLLKTLPLLRKRGEVLPMIVGFTKRPDRLVLPDDDETKTIIPEEQALHYLERMRDEAHRFAKAYHLLLRRKTLQKIVEELQ